jgi:hypothetical protein
MSFNAQVENNDILHRRSTPSSRLIHNNLILIHSIPVYIDIKVDSKKGVSNPITKKEIDILTEIFGLFDGIHFHNLHYLNTGAKIIIQNYINNCWWIGILNNIDGNKIILDDAIYIERSNGTIYNASPSTRQLTCNIFDSFFIIKH